MKRRAVRLQDESAPRTGAWPREKPLPTKLNRVPSNLNRAFWCVLPSLWARRRTRPAGWRRRSFLARLPGTLAKPFQMKDFSLGAPLERGNLWSVSARRA